MCHQCRPLLACPPTAADRSAVAGAGVNPRHGVAMPVAMSSAGDARPGLPSPSLTLVGVGVVACGFGHRRLSQTHRSQSPAVPPAVAGRRHGRAETPKRQALVASVRTDSMTAMPSPGGRASTGRLRDRPAPEGAERPVVLPTLSAADPHPRTRDSVCTDPHARRHGIDTAAPRQLPLPRLHPYRQPLSSPVALRRSAAWADRRLCVTAIAWRRAFAHHPAPAFGDSVLGQSLGMERKDAPLFKHIVLSSPPTLSGRDRHLPTCEIGRAHV